MFTVGLFKNRQYFQNCECFPCFLRILEKFSKKLKIIVSDKLLTKDEMIFDNLWLCTVRYQVIDLFAVLKKNLDRTIFHHIL